MGDIAGDLSSKRGRISGTNALAGGMVTVTGQVPLAELGNYQSELKSVTGGMGSLLPMPRDTLVLNAIRKPRMDKTR